MTSNGTTYAQQDATLEELRDGIILVLKTIKKRIIKDLFY